MRTTWDELFGWFEAGAIEVSAVTTPMFEALHNWPGDIADAWRSAIDPIVGSVQDIVSGIVDALDPSKLVQHLHLPGFAEGGVIPGPTGRPRLIVAHAGETVLPTHRPELAALRGLDAADTFGASLAAPAMAPGGGLNVGAINVAAVAEPWPTAKAIIHELRRTSYLAGGT